MVDHLERWRFPFTPLELRQLWTYSDGDRTIKGYRFPSGTDKAGSWALVDPATGNAEGVVPPGEFARRFRPVDAFADVLGFPTYLGTVTAPDGTALVDLILDRDPFMLANGPRRAARPHVLMVPRRHRDGWSSATAQELAGRHTAMTLIAAWYRSLDGGHVVFAANDSGRRGDDEVLTKNPRQDVEHAHLHGFYLEGAATENHESLALAEGQRAFTAALGSDAVRVELDGTGFAARLRSAAQPWGGSYCSYQPGVDGPFWVMPALGPAQDEFNRRLARADGLEAGPDPKLGGAVNLMRPTLADAGRRRAAQHATAELRTSFGTFLAQRGLNARSLAADLV